MSRIDPYVKVNDIRLFTRWAGRGNPLILVHGAWAEHNSWQLVVRRLAKSFQVVAYDRRGHSRSERTHGPRSTHEDDLAALIETLDLAPAYVAGFSYGGSIALGLAARRPDLVRGVIAHEPPLFRIGEHVVELRQAMRTARTQLEDIADLIQSENARQGAQKFIDEVALGPGAWVQLPMEIRQTMIENAPTFLAAMTDPRWADLDVDALARTDCPVLLTDCDLSPPHYTAVIAELGRQIKRAWRHTFPGAGHMPHLSQPSEYAQIVRLFGAATKAESP